MVTLDFTLGFTGVGIQGEMQNTMEPGSPGVLTLVEYLVQTLV